MSARTAILSIAAVAVPLGLLLLIDRGWSDYTEDRDNHRNIQEKK